MVFVVVDIGVAAVVDAGDRAVRLCDPGRHGRELEVAVGDTQHDHAARRDVAFVIVRSASDVALVLTLCLDRVPRSNFAMERRE